MPTQTALLSSAWSGTGAELLAAGIIGATYLWIGLRVLIDGDLQAPAARALALTTIVLACFYYGELARITFPAWEPFQDRLFASYIALTTTGWLAVAVYHTRRSFSTHRWRWHRAALIAAGFSATVLAVLGWFNPRLMLIPVGDVAGGYQAAWLYLPLAAHVQLSLAAALAIFIRARRINHRADNIPARRRYGLMIWFVLATACAMIGPILIDLSALAGLRLVTLSPTSLPILQWPALVATLTCAAFLLVGITTSRQLLGRPVRTPFLLFNWCVLVLILVLLIGVELWVVPPGNRRYEVFGVALLAPLGAALIDWAQFRTYRQAMVRIRSFIQDAISTSLDPNACRAQAQRVFETLVAELDASAVYIELRRSDDEQPFVLNYNWPTTSPRPREGSPYDVRSVAVAGQRLGFIALLGPRGTAYSMLELDLAEDCACAIAGLYLDARQAEAIENLVFHRERERQELNQRLQRVLHDQVGGNLDAIDKLARLLPDSEAELREEMSDAARESMAAIRSLLRDELANLFPTVLLREGLIAALRAELLPQYQGDRFRDFTVQLRYSNLNDDDLNRLLSDDLKRTLYAALGEALRNAARYAGGEAGQAVRVRLEINYEQIRGLFVDVFDNGVGFAPELAQPTYDGVGLRYHQAALRLAGGMMHVASQPGKGTHVQLHLPTRLLGNDERAGQHSLVALSGLDWARMVQTIESRSPGRLLVNNNLSDLTRTATVMVEHYRYHAPGETMVQQFVEADEARQRWFLHDAHNAPYRELVDRQRLERYITSGQHEGGSQIIDATLARQHVRYLIELLKTYQHFELALSDQQFESNFAIKPGQAVLWEKRNETGHDRLDGIIEGICASDPATVAEFTRRFEQAWHNVPPRYRDKPQVIAWLEAQLARAEGRLTLDEAA